MKGIVVHTSLVPTPCSFPLVAQCVDLNSDSTFAVLEYGTQTLCSSTNYPQNGYCGSTNYLYPRLLHIPPSHTPPEIQFSFILSFKILAFYTPSPLEFPMTIHGVGNWVFSGTAHYCSTSKQINADLIAVPLRTVLYLLKKTLLQTLHIPLRSFQHTLFLIK